MKKLLLCMSLILAWMGVAKAQEPDPNFHIYLCIGQSNMEGAGAIEPVDRDNVPERFKMMAAVNFNNPSRQMYKWYTATPPLVRQGTGLCPVDWFGRTMVDNLPEEVNVGVIVVAVGGCKIEHLDKDFDPADLANEADWFKSFMSTYNNKPYDRLIACAKEAQKAGVIKGVLLHQGCSNNCDQQWPNKVKKVYNDILADLDLEAENVPLFVGELVQSDLGGACGAHNGIINRIGKTIPTAHVISSANLPHKGDGLHFTSHSYRVLGCRYATAALKLMGIEEPIVNYSEEEPVIPKPNPSEGDFVFDLDTFNPKIWENGTWNKDTHVFVAGQYGFGGWQYDQPLDLSGYQYIVAELEEPDNNGVSFRVFDTASYWEPCFTRDFNGTTLIVSDLKGMMKTLSNGTITAVNTDEIYRVGFWAYGGKQIKIKQVFCTNVDPYNSVANVGVDAVEDYTVYNLQGQAVLTAANETELASLPTGLYIVNGKKQLIH